MSFQSQTDNPKWDFVSLDSGTGSAPRPSPSKTLATTLLQECHNLLSELNALQSHLTALKKPSLVELRQFKSVIQSELKALERLSEQAISAPSAEVKNEDSGSDNGGNS